MGLVALWSACTQQGVPQLQGTWRGSKAEGVRPEAQGVANQWVAQLELSFKKDTLSISLGTDKKTGHYTLIQAQENTFVILADKDKPNETQIFTLITPNTLKWSVGEGQNIVLTRR
ncbi:hypothetical protein BCY86_07735 [Pajaroellobacter abortibovis]|uniref:Lipocalin-like domain-containing protein n=2 Tax=Pajaroellobacter abortibovis TaxID=1882918 RepID=A0A1L6MYK4_9BACT|nr:hypothetical protein BCY86_07735 [Pajaroellobacter abortibovis]